MLFRSVAKENFIQQMLNKASEDVKDISKIVKVLVESNKAMKEELSRLQEDLENMSEEELQSLNSTDQESTMPEPIAVGVEQEHTVGVNTSDPMVFDVGQTHALTNGAAYVIKNKGVNLTVMHVGGNSIEFGLCYRGHFLLIGGYHKAKNLNDGFQNRADYNFNKGSRVNWDPKVVSQSYDLGDFLSTSTTGEL